MDLAELMQTDVKNVFLDGDFTQTAIFKSKSSLKEITVQFFEQSLDQLDTTYFHAWCSYAEVKTIAKNDTLEINGVVYGIVDFSPDEFESGVNIFLQKA